MAVDNMKNYLWDGAIVVGLSPLLLPVAVGKMVHRLYKYTTQSGNLKHLPSVTSMWFPMSEVRSPGKVEAVLEELKQEDGSFPPIFFFGPHMDGSPTVGIASVPAFRKVFTNDSLFPKFEPFYEIIKDAAGADGGLVALAGEAWKKARKLLTPHFHFDRLSEGVPKITSVSHSKWDELCQSGSLSSVDVNRVFSDVALSVIIKYAFGDRVPLKIVADAFDEMVKGLPSYIFLLTIFGRVAAYLPFSSKLKMDKSRKIIRKIVINILKDISAAKRQAEKGENHSESDAHSSVDNSLLDSVIAKARHENDKKAIDVAVSEGILFLFAAQDTTSNTLSFAVEFLSRPENIHYQQKVRDEAKRVFGSARRVLEAGRTDVNQLQFCEQVINETLRLTPAVPFIDRMTSADVEIEGHVIPKHTAIFPFFAAIHRNSAYWKEPTRFMPERFDEGEVYENFSFAPFSAGRRNCIGQKLAMMEAKLVLASFLLRFRVEAVTLKPAVWSLEATMKPHNLRVKLVPIADSDSD
uniref:Cytochrome P450 n=1 Tax=Palpitomonas bilix TaxID=652834 RepID=A0A7S3GDJ3_9EUKA|mmetsp:Transcript_4481/g.9206  ORF Transcript_4481/g.9206 Transcript_4481/m.9206 type:complete len:522 (+) Transcript_4481:369-1934(+)